MGIAIQRLDQRHGELGDRLGRVRGHIGDEEAELLGGGEVDVVVARAAKEDSAHANVVKLGEDWGGEGVVYEDADGGGAVG